jgi:hypothetical protein
MPGVALITPSGAPRRATSQVAPGGAVDTDTTWLDPLTMEAQPESARTDKETAINLNG